MKSRHGKGPHKKPGVLYVVATPLGNPADITLRALDILGGVDLAAAEDTRDAARLFSAHDIKTPLISFHEHNELARTPELVKRLENGLNVALLSQAGTPLISDPGYRLVREAAKKGLTISPVPGPSAAIAGLSASGLPTDSFLFAGFPVKKGEKRLAQLQRAAGSGSTVIFYESPKRIQKLLSELMEIAGDRECVLAREMTKTHEEFIRGRLSDVAGELDARASVKGECTLILAGEKPESAAADEDIVIEAIKKDLAEKQLKPADIAKRIARQHGMDRKRVYALVTDLKAMSG